MRRIRGPRLQFHASAGGTKKKKRKKEQEIATFIEQRRTLTSLDENPRHREIERRVGEWGWGGVGGAKWSMLQRRKHV